MHILKDIFLTVTVTVTFDHNHINMLWNAFGSFKGIQTEYSTRTIHVTCTCGWCQQAEVSNHVTLHGNLQVSQRASW